MCVGLPKTAELLFLAALFFVSFFWANKKKKSKRIFNITYKKSANSNVTQIVNGPFY